MKSKTTKKSVTRKESDSEYNDEHKIWLRKWLTDNYVMKEDTSLQSQLVYTHYTYSCSAQGITYVDHVGFFEVMKEVFPAVELNKLPGKRDKDGWEYGCIDILPNSDEYTTVAKGRKINSKMSAKRSLTPESSSGKKAKIASGSRECPVNGDQPVKDVSTSTDSVHSGKEGVLCDRCQSSTSSRTASAPEIQEVSPNSKAVSKSQKFFLSIECVSRGLDSDEFIVSVRADSAVDVCTSNSAESSNAILNIRTKSNRSDRETVNCTSGADRSFHGSWDEIARSSAPDSPESSNLTCIRDQRPLCDVAFSTSQNFLDKSCVESIDKRHQDAGSRRNLTDQICQNAMATPTNGTQTNSEDVTVDDDSGDNCDNMNKSVEKIRINLRKDKAQRKRRKKAAKRLASARKSVIVQNVELRDNTPDGEAASETNDCDIYVDKNLSNSTSCEHQMEQECSRTDVSSRNKAKEGVESTLLSVTTPASRNITPQATEMERVHYADSSEDQTDGQASDQEDTSQDELSSDLQLPNLQFAMAADLTRYFQVGKKKSKATESQRISENGHGSKAVQSDFSNEQSVNELQKEKPAAESQISATPEKDSHLVPSPDMKWQSLPKKFKEEHWDLVLEWLEGEYEESSSVCLPRLVMYNHYLDMCKSKGLVPAKQLTFGRMIMSRFKQLSMRRLGSRGNSQYCYMGVDVREESSYYDHISQHRIVCTLGKPKHSTFPQGPKTPH